MSERTEALKRVRGHLRAAFNDAVLASANDFNLLERLTGAISLVDDRLRDGYPGEFIPAPPDAPGEEARARRDR